MALYHAIIEALDPLIDAFEQFGIQYYIGGSVSSSIHGMARRTQDVDVIADIQVTRVHLLAQFLQNDYYLDEQVWRDAIHYGQSYNLIHLNTMMKVDLMPFKRRAFTKEEAHRAQLHILEAGTHPLNIASAEDAILTKLEWFHMGGRTSGRQWNDILEIIRRQGVALDLVYLRKWADTLGVRDLFEKALVDTGNIQP